MVIGFYLDFLFFCEVCIDFDLIVEVFLVFVFLIDFNWYLCGIVLFYGVVEFLYFDDNFFIVGFKFYGCVFIFFMKIGYE